MKRTLRNLAPLLLPLAAVACAKPQSPSEQKAVVLRDKYLSRYQPLSIQRARAWWESNTSGTPEAFERQKRAKAALVELNSDAATFAAVRDLRKQGQVRDPLLKRQLDVMYREMLPNQADKKLQNELIAIETEVERIFNTHRGTVGGRELSENDIRDILATTTNSAEAQRAWCAFMDVGAKVDALLRRAVTIRNEQARKLGYRDFYAMMLDLQEIDEKQFIALFDELDRLTAPPFEKLKAGIDSARAIHFNVSIADLRPWHYADLFFQAAPPMPEADLNQVYARQDLLALTKTYYKGLGLDVDDILARSDLYEKPGKSPHAFATDIDRAGDQRVLCNLKPNLYWMDTLLHELGHAVYDKYIDRTLPFLLRTPSHSITTEGYSMMMGAMAKNQEFLLRVVKLSPGEADAYVKSARQSLKAEKLIFSRWAQVMVRFERAMYANPDQDLNKLWWDLKKKYQLLTPPEDLTTPNYGAKIHIVTVPVYYHSYLMGDLFASQVHHHIAKNIVRAKDANATCFHGNVPAGDYMKQAIFAPGNRFSWNELTKKATGEALTPKYFVRQYIAN